MRKLIKNVILLSLVMLSFAAVHARAAAPMRCGWIVLANATDYYLVDRDGKWLINSSTYKAGGQDYLSYPNAGSLDTEYFVQTGPHKVGYGCGCVQGIVDKSAMKFVRVISSNTDELRRCSDDKNLPSKP